MTGEDLSAISTELANSLAGSEALLHRDSQSPPWVISIQKVLNLTSDVMTESEQWVVMARIQSSLPIQSLWDTRNIRFVIPAEKRRHIRSDQHSNLSSTAFGKERLPTHLMTATFHSVTRASSSGRTDLYYCEFELMDLAGGVPVWSDRFEYKRAASGHPLD